MNRNELISNVAKYTSTVLVAPVVSAGVAVGGVSLAVYYFLKNVPFKNWKTTTLTLLTSGTLFFNSELGKPTRDAVSTYLNNSLHEKIEQQNIEIDFLQNKNKETINFYEAKISDTTKYLESKLETKLDSAKLVNDTRTSTLKEIYTNEFKKLSNAQKGTEKELDQVKKNQETIVGYIGHNSKTIESIDRTLKEMQMQSAKNKNKDLERRINIQPPKQEFYVQNKNIKDETYWTTIDKGESLSKIAQEHYGSWNAFEKIAKANGIKDPSKVEIGQPIILPRYGLKKKSGLNKSKFPTNMIILNKGEDLTNKLRRDYNLSWTKATNKAKEIVSYNKSIGNEYATMNKISYNKIIMSLK